MKFSQRIIAPTLLVVVLGALLIQLPGMARDRQDSYTWFQPVQDILVSIDREYVEEPDYNKLQLGAIQGMIESLNDPYTEFIPKEYLSDFRKATEGSYAGIGASVRIENGWMTIISPMPGSPALEAGIQAGDQIRQIEDKTTWEEPIDDSIDRLTGTPETPVQVKVHRLDAPEDEILDITIIRRQIQVQTVEGVHRVGVDWNYWLDPNEKIACLRIKQFTQTTPDELLNALSPLIDQGLNGLVLDLRFNPGGLLWAANEVCDLFLDQGAIVSVRDRTGNGNTFSADAEGTLPDFPIIVIVNSQSASASEIVAGALKDNGRGKVLGTRSFGKGLVQDVIHDLESGAGWLKITTAHYYLPSGRNIHKTPESTEWGVDPDDGFYLPLSNTEYRRVIEIQNELEVIRNDNGEGSWDDQQWVRDRLEDPQINLALDTMHTRINEGVWKPTGETIDPDEELLAQLENTERLQEYYQAQLDRANEEIERLSALVPEEDQPDPWYDVIPDDSAVNGGTLTIRDENGEVVSVGRIDDQARLKNALLMIDIQPAEDNTEENP